MSTGATTDRPARRDRPAAAHDPDAELMARVRDDDPDAFAELIDRFWPRVFGRFYRLLADRQEAEDLAQDVFLRLYRARRRYRPTARFNTWLFHIVQNVARNALRSRRRKPVLRFGGLHEAEELPHHFPPLWSDADDGPAHPLEQRELAGLVRAAVSDLGERQRTALELFQFHQHSYAEIAAHMDMTPKAAKSLLYRARLQLKSQLAKVVVW